MTDGTEHLPGAAGPGPSNPHPPHLQAIPPQQAAPFAQPAFPAPPPPFVPAQGEPDWAAMADRQETRTRRRKVWIGGAIAAVSVVGVAAGTLVVTSAHGSKSSAASTPLSSSLAAAPSSSTSGSAAASASSSASSSSSTSASPASSAVPSSAAASAGGPAASRQPSAGATPSPTRAPVTTPTVPGNPNVLADHAGQADLPLGPDAGLKAVSGGSALSLKGNTNSYAQSTTRLVDVGASFTVSAWVYNDAADGSRSAISEGDGASFVFDLGRDDSNGQKAWVFRVQTADGGADATTVQVRTASAATVSQWTLLTGTYDAGARTITLYVNDTSAGAAKVPGIWAGPGPLELGRSRQHGAWANPWAGVIGHIQVWAKALSSGEVASVKSSGGAGPGAQPFASWLV